MTILLVQFAYHKIMLIYTNYQLLLHRTPKVYAYILYDQNLKKSTVKGVNKFNVIGRLGIILKTFKRD